jgi:hypothetical protein
MRPSGVKAGRYVVAAAIDITPGSNRIGIDGGPLPKGDFVDRIRCPGTACVTRTKIQAHRTTSRTEGLFNIIRLAIKFRWNVRTNLFVSITVDPEIAV